MLTRCSRAVNPVAQILQHLAVSEETYYRWRNQFGGMKAEEAKRLKELELENEGMRGCTDARGIFYRNFCQRRRRFQPKQKNFNCTLIRYQPRGLNLHSLRCAHFPTQEIREAVVVSNVLKLRPDRNVGCGDCGWLIHWRTSAEKFFEDF